MIGYLRVDKFQADFSEVPVVLWGGRWNRYKDNQEKPAPLRWNEALKC